MFRGLGVLSAFLTFTGLRPYLRQAGILTSEKHPSIAPPFARAVTGREGPSTAPGSGGSGALAPSPASPGRLPSLGGLRAADIFKGKMRTPARRGLRERDEAETKGIRSRGADGGPTPRARSPRLRPA